jgi:hypothetical protein
MKNLQLTSILGSGLIACALSIGALAPSASAQGKATAAEVNIPFAFQTPTQTMPAGLYRINKESTHLILLRGPGQTSDFISTYDSIKTRAPEHGAVVFARYGNQYFLRQIWTAGDTVGAECPKGRAEKATLLARNEHTPTSIDVTFDAAPKH